MVKWIGFSLALVLMSGCANQGVVDGCLVGPEYGFWYGLLHGIIAPVNFILMLFNGDDYTVYAQHNNGAWYAFGFLLGSGGWGILGGSRMKNKRQPDY